MDLLIGHLLGDYVFQSDWMANNKKKKGIDGFLVCSIHCLIWSLFVYLSAFSNHSLFIVIVLFISHFIIDRTNMIKIYLNFFRIMPNPSTWKIIVVDNSIHLLCIYLLYIYLN